MRPAEILIQSVDAVFKDPHQQKLLADAVGAWYFDAVAQSPALTGAIPPALVAQIVKDMFSALLGRDPEEEALEHYSEIIARPNGIRDALASVVESGEFRQRFSRTLPELPHPELTFDEPATVFLHVQKTGGTSLKNMFIDAFDGQQMYLEYADTLHLRSPAELAQFNTFMGHFNYDSLAYIPKRNLKLISFLRDPADRLASLYRFWRAHAPSHPSFHSGMEAANRLEFEDFLVEQRRAPHSDTWNHMTWAILGNRAWWRWVHRLCDDVTLNDEDTDNMLEEFRAEIREQLKRFTFIGMQHDFERSCQILSDNLSCGHLTVRHDHTIQLLTQLDPLIKDSTVPNSLNAEYTPPVIAMTQLDSILFEEAQATYTRVTAALQDLSSH
ncbi:sulfotransferase family 2 domain-containing protein [Burkholderia cenocepacia]|uniref:sulfotransferase family 2 domain-containing protein n=1 Tax=Burkholderia cenocepacia TaxID=95486 RepID=UPI001B9520EE|nr:sulfotransferase family 2 domain-containing protein [Burkholderia cenocepacia]MBR8377267.1 sulfotransferase family 2 domain-containing protein [Burkholderia cenocepacia]